MIRAFAVALTLLALLPAAAHAAGPFQPVGLWRFFHTDGKPFLARLMPDQSATTDFGQGEVGIWRWEGQRVRVYYTSGWDDVLYQKDGVFHKAGWAPGADHCGPPSNDAVAEHVSDDPAAKP
ncbi:hypothetical protein EDC65_3360 [Stella humosa]|uniref:Uncharacterized protein n=1 Tax=Stella humosa TaxID=94 RepID=A0A3N1L3N3_9PROT|nr:hypothetical protein [Stella humosa]ROP84015.1 hypothetical protein EDC65_3360 [Stella humosa]BBK33524.1 hypothetical protein STHU_41580 [Stella humosa]